jgi:predicted metal-dependent peptidase
MTARERIQKEVEQWFLTEPVFFAVYCSHRLVMNANMLCPLRSGKGRIEYNPTIIEAVPDTMLRDLMRIEVIRILLQHPYARQPMGCPSLVLQTASDLVISPAYNLAWANLAHPEDFDLPTGQNYEWYAMRLNEQLEKLQQAQDDSKQQQERESEQQQGSKKKQGQGNSQGRQQGQYGGQSGQQGGNEQESEQQGQGNGELQQGQGRGQGEQPNEMAVHRDGDAPCKGNFGGQQGEESTEDNRQKTTDNSQGNEGDELTEDKSQQSTVDGQGNEGDELTKDDSQQSTVDGNEEDESHAKPTSGYTDLWEEDQFQARQITDIVKSSSSWGSLPGGLIELIKKTAEGKIDYRAVLRMFRASILSQKRRLTRMRPSRRFGFEQMGSRYDFTTRLLIAIDTSGSVGSEDLGRYLNVTTSFFKYGIQQIDVLMFDAKVQGKPLALTDAKKNIKELKVCGRGGTDFQAPVDYAVEHPEYDGLIIITDGCAPCPDTERLRTKLLWVIDNESDYKSIYENLRKTGRVCLLDR